MSKNKQQLIREYKFIGKLINCLEVNLTKMWNIPKENFYESSLNDIKGDSSDRDTLFSWIETLSIMKVSILSKLIHKFYITAVIFSPGIFEDLDTLTLKSYGKVKSQQEPRKSRRIKSRRRKMRRKKRQTIYNKTFNKTIGTLKI